MLPPSLRAGESIAPSDWRRGDDVTFGLPKLLVFIDWFCPTDAVIGELGALSTKEEPLLCLDVNGLKQFTAAAEETQKLLGEIMEALTLLVFGCFF